MDPGRARQSGFPAFFNFDIMLKPSRFAKMSPVVILGVSDSFLSSFIA
jgi:hypothetical protein